MNYPGPIENRHASMQLGLAEKGWGKSSDIGLCRIKCILALHRCGFNGISLYLSTLVKSGTKAPACATLTLTGQEAVFCQSCVTLPRPCAWTRIANRYASSGSCATWGWGS